MAKIAVLGGTGYLASLIKNQNICKKKINIFFFSRKRIQKIFLITNLLKKI